MALSISHLIAADAPLLTTPDSEPLFSPTEPFDYGFYSLPPSPPLSDLPSPLRTPDPEPVCFPTHQVFDLERPSTPSSVATQCTNDTTSTDSIVPTGCKRSASPAPPVAKKRAVGDRVSSKDFVPPDVTGLSKREARLVKNRAAAFLSRQRKREEFELMEIRVAELEQENKRLLILALQNQNQPQTSAEAPSDTVATEVESLKAQLAAAQERAKSLSAQLEQRTEANSSPIIKVEPRDDISTTLSAPASSPPRSTVLPSAHKSSASLGLMVLLCALPSLLSMRIQSPASATNVDDLYAVSNTFYASGASSAFDFDFDKSMFSPNEFDWSYSKSSSFVDLDEEHSKMTSGTRKLEFTGIDSLEGETGLRNLGDLGDLDISFDTAPSDDGKIRVRIHPTSPSTSSTSSRSVSRGATPEGEDSSTSPSLSSTSSPRSRTSALGVGSLSYLSTTSRDPFLGITSLSDTDDIDMSSYTQDEDSNSYESTLDKGSSFLWSLSSSLSSLRGDCGMDRQNTVGTVHGKRRVRIALKSAPQAASEGGEWEVQIC